MTLKQRQIILDIGNTNVKSAISEDYQLKDVLVWQNITELVQYILSKDFSKVFISSVSGQESEIINIINGRISTEIFNTMTPLPIKLHYDTIETLGVDRIAGVVGAFRQFPNANNLVIDIGTCITYDFISEQNIYEGGAISPGLRIRYKAMHEYTGKLPMIEADAELENFIGKSTRSSMISGVLQGIVGEIEGFIHTYRGKYQNINVIITGGDSERFESLINTPIFVAPKLVLQGLNCILEYNDNKS